MKTLRVLVPLDGSPLSEAILPFVARLERPAVTLLRVVDEHARALDAEAQADLERADRRARAEGLGEVARLLRRGDPAEEILRAADELGPALVALSTHGQGGGARRPLGRVAAKVFHATRFPLLAVRADRAPPPTEPLFARVLVPASGTPLSWNAVRELEVLGAAGHARLTLFGILELLVVGPHEDAAHHRPTEEFRDPLDRFLAVGCEQLRERLERQSQRARDLGFEANADVEVGRPAPRILERAAAERATLIGMATRKRTELSRLALGSVTEDVLASATVPLLVVS